MDRELRALERMLNASGKKFKVLDERSIALLSAHFQGEIETVKKTYNRYVVFGRRSGQTAQAAAAYERLNNLVAMLELILDD